MIACLKGNQTMIKLLICSDADPNQRILLEDFLLLRRLKTSRKSIKIGSRYTDTAGCGNILVTADILGALDGQQESDQFRQLGNKTPARLTPEYNLEKYICLFEMAAIRGDYQAAVFLLGL